jgi:hypothetical protein
MRMPITNVRARAIAAVRGSMLHLAFQFERLIVISALENPATRDQFSKFLPSEQTGEQLDRAIAIGHREIFEDWLYLSAEEQLSDIEAYATLQGQTTAQLSRQWLSPASRDCLTPRDVLPAEKLLFQGEADLLLSLASGPR